MLSVYFDTNVYDAIEKGDIPAEEVDALRAGLRRGEIVSHLSFSDVEELLGQWETDRQAAIRRLRVARDLVGFRGMLKQPSDLLKDAILAYANGMPSPAPTLPRHDRRLLASLLNRIANGNARLADEVSQVVSTVRARKEEFRHVMMEARDQASAEWASIPDERRAVTFDEYFAAGATQWAEDFARYHGLADACRERGVGGMLDIRAVRLSVGALMSFTFSLIVGDGLRPRQPSRSDYYDLWHALLASVADVFVTRDERLAKSLARVPADGFRVVTSLGAIV